MTIMEDFDIFLVKSDDKVIESDQMSLSLSILESQYNLHA